MTNLYKKTNFKALLVTKIPYLFQEILSYIKIKVKLLNKPNGGEKYVRNGILL